MCKRLDFPKSPFIPSQSTGAVFQHLSLLSGDQLTGRSPPCLRCCQSCFPPHLTGDTCEFTWPLWEVRVSLNSFTSVGPGRYKPATPALSSFLHHAVLRNSPFPSITHVPLWGEQDRSKAQGQGQSPVQSTHGMVSFRTRKRSYNWPQQSLENAAITCGQRFLQTSQCKLLKTALASCDTKMVQQFSKTLNEKQVSHSKE